MLKDIFKLATVNLKKNETMTKCQISEGQVNVSIELANKNGRKKNSPKNKIVEMICDSKMLPKN